MDWAPVILIIPILLLVDLVRTNWEDEDRSGHCQCFNKKRGLRNRWAMLRSAVDQLVVDPNRMTVSLAAHMIGRVLGFFWFGRPYIRIPVDVYFLEQCDGRMHVYGCINDTAHMKVLPGGRKVCPSGEG